ncbi:peroxiredoxin [Cohnella sp. WQ 127256]|uniref:peroxiredoxin family protein n=1 Tax=Cohnella sp. WQ 127256 TaxID=2938790 RepID=UPI002118F6B9|nr:redoxin domain-containing protein [Cohnella sp. WQ 127256]
MLMPNLQVGTFVLNIELLIYILAGMVGVLAVKYRLKLHPDRERIVSDTWNAVFLWVVVWKGSLFLFDPAGVIDHPMSLLFFSGGTRGIWLATVVVIGYLAFRQIRRLGYSQAAAIIATMCSAAMVVLFLLQIVLYDSAGSLSYWALMLSAAILILLLSPSRRYAVQALGIALVVSMIASAVYDQVGRGTSEQAASSSEVGIRNNQVAPNFQLTDIDGNTVQLSDYRGQKVLLNFWATWCKVCKTEMPHVEKLYQKFKDEGVVVLSVNSTSLERNIQLAGSYAEKHSLSFPIVLDDQGSVIKQYKVTAYPTTFILDSEGVIRSQYLGAVSYESMKKAVLAIG